MLTRRVGEIVWVGGDMTPMYVMEPDQQRDAPDRTRRSFVKLRPETRPDAEGQWYRSDVVTGGGEK